MNLKQGSLVLTSYVVFAAAVGSVSAVPPPPHEYGLRGLRRIEIVFVNVARGGVTSGVVATDTAVPPEPPTEDLVSHMLANDEECRQIGPTLTRLGFDVVEHCRPDDTACGKLFLTTETASIPGVVDRALSVGIELRQPVQLARDTTVDLSVPTTWSEHQVGVVAAQHSATRTSCVLFRNLATWFGSIWMVANK